MIFKTLKGIVLGLRTAPLWIKSLDYASQGKHEESKQLLIRMERFGLFSEVEYCLLRGYVEYELGNSENSLVYLYRSIEGLPKERRCNDDEIRYFEAYAHWLINLQEEEQGKHFKIDFDIINLNKVAKPFLENYPLRIHPNW